MPQNPVLIYEKESGTPTYMHTVDAAEAVRLGDYTSVPPGEELDPAQRASALSRFKTGQGVTHPELQTEEEKAEARRKANEEAALLAGVPPGTPVVVMAPSAAERESATTSRRAGTSANAPPETTARTPPRASGASAEPRKD